MYFDAAGRPLTTTLPNGVTSAYRYDTAHRIVGLSHATITGTLANYTYTLNAAGSPVVVTETVRPPGAAPAPDLLFADGFESGDLAAWSGSSTNGGNLSVTAAAALHGSYGLNVNINDNTSLYVQDDTPNDETRYRARFRFDPNSIAMGSTDQHQLFWGYSGASTDVVRVVFRCTGGTCPASGSYQVRVELRDTASNWTTSSWFTLTDAPHDLELDWQASASGSLTFWLDGSQEANLTGVNNSNRDIDFVRWGPLTGIDTGTRGAYYLDDFESRTTTYIGPSGAGTGSLVTHAITNTYDALYRATDVLYADGTHFQYAYDAAGNVLTRTQTVLSVTVVTTYTYNAANQLVTAKSDNAPIVWHYTYDANGSLTEVTPDGSAGSGALRYTYNAALQLVQVERHDGSAYQLVSEMLYDGLGQRRQVTAWEGGLSATTTYAVDGERGGAVLAATTAGQTTFYVHGPHGPLAELTTSWGFYLADGQGTARQLADASGAVTLARRYTPWGEILDQEGSGNFAWGYFGGLMDAATGLIYVGGGQYFDPATGRFLTRAVAPGAPNPYVPWRADPLGAALGPADGNGK